MINGQEIWDLSAERSDARLAGGSDRPGGTERRGISVLLVPLRYAGDHDQADLYVCRHVFNEVFYDNVRVPREALIGEENRGWYIIADATHHERVTVGIDDYIDLVQFYDLLLVGAPRRPARAAQGPGGATDSRSASHRPGGSPGALDGERDARGAGRYAHTRGIDGEGVGDRARHRLEDAAVDLLGRRGLLRRENADAPMRGRAEATYRYAPVVRFAGGTNEVQRNIIAQRGFGLPR